MRDLIMKDKKIKETDKFYAAKIRSIENRKNAENEALERFKEREKKTAEKNWFNFLHR